jgi:subtilisin
VTVAVLDTGIDWTHLNTLLGEFYQRDAGGYNVPSGGGSYFDDHGHGTHMVGVSAAAWNGLGIIGAALQAKLVAVKVLDSTGHGYLSDVINGLQWVYNSDMRLVNKSFGFSSDSTPLQQAIQSLHNKGVIMVGAAGNRCAAATASEEGSGDFRGPAVSCPALLTDVRYPATYQWVLAVGASDIHHYVPDYSLSGLQLDVVAPDGAPEVGAPDSGQILSTNRGTGYGWGSGTGQAAAHVTGAAALALQLKPGLSFTQMRSVLQTTAKGPGRINVCNMAQALLP